MRSQPSLCQYIFVSDSLQTHGMLEMSSDYIECYWYNFDEKSIQDNEIQQGSNLSLLQERLLSDSHLSQTGHTTALCTSVGKNQHLGFMG